MSVFRPQASLLPPTTNSIFAATKDVWCCLPLISSPSPRTVSYIDLQGDWSPDEYRMACATVDHLVVDRYHDYKLKEHNHLKEHGQAVHTLRRMERTIVHFMENLQQILPRVVPEDDKEVDQDENDSGGLGDP
ncbi:hypothetical protein Adt_35125 [Abeliophyllum distichum]|uniref:Uncharacterized protein n=1 Tax=Abeliophyllum distichum TaxID=126358 RepID=A0ABD1QES8_9LAMI